MCQPQVTIRQVPNGASFVPCCTCIPFTRLRPWSHVQREAVLHHSREGSPFRAWLPSRQLSEPAPSLRDSYWGTYFLHDALKLEQKDLQGRLKHKALGAWQSVRLSKSQWGREFALCPG